MKNLILTLLIFTLFGCTNNGNDSITGSGIIEATEILTSSQLPGKVLSVDVSEGLDVDAGTQIAQIDTEKIVLQKQQIQAGIKELKLNYQNAQRGIDLAKSNYNNILKKFNRISALFEQQSVTQQQYDDVETALKGAKTQLDNARNSLRALAAKEEQLNAQLALLSSQLRDAKITAPIKGTILAKYISAGEIARPGSPIVSIAELENLWIKVYLTEKELGRIKLGDTVQLEVGAFSDKTYPGTIAWISPKAEFTPQNVQTKEARADLVYAVKVNVKNPDGELKIGMPGDVVF